MAFRLDEETKIEIMSEIERLTNLHNKEVSSEEYLFRKNDIIVEALKKGLKLLAKKFEN